LPASRRQICCQIGSRMPWLSWRGSLGAVRSPNLVQQPRPDRLDDLPPRVRDHPT
jgi:hypothetical protein